MISMASYCDAPINTFNEYSWEIVARRIPPILQENMEKKYPDWHSQLKGQNIISDIDC
jgi:hypothetical protein